MPQMLDRPIWHSLRSRQSEFAVGGLRAVRYDRDVSPFAAAEDDGSPALDELAGLIPADGGIVLLQAGECPLPPGAVVEMAGEGLQMVARAVDAPPPSPAVLDLADADAPQMQALATLTKPGPFLHRTHRLGRFVGIREEGRLVAMAGERMKLPGFTEVSGVCTHPDARRRGYAGLLSRIVARRILGRGETPFLHVFADNHAAIRVYESLGFETRSRMAVRFLRRA